MFTSPDDFTKNDTKKVNEENFRKKDKLECHPLSYAYKEKKPIQDGLKVISFNSFVFCTVLVDN